MIGFTSYKLAFFCLATTFFGVAIEELFYCFLLLTHKLLRALLFLAVLQAHYDGSFHEVDRAVKSLPSELDAHLAYFVGTPDSLMKVDDFFVLFDVFK